MTSLDNITSSTSKNSLLQDVSEQQEEQEENNSLFGHQQLMDLDRKVEFYDNGVRIRLIQSTTTGEKQLDTVITTQVAASITLSTGTATVVATTTNDTTPETEDTPSTSRPVIQTSC